eukprot:TRINITY_DN2372_c0_g1_i8.p1 TRINITY_DN2372_c0_g1~~TRINITY_DN2372_c0_g1_i8.p1  ORF type:complete len:406 (+),score=80.95 TRINITY_DN2372_c0_g1_i8:202-1419(+)
MKHIPEPTAHKRNSSATWSKEHDDYLVSLIDIHGENNWQAIVEQMNKKFKECKKSDKDCSSRWKTLMGAGGKKLQWSDRERYLLLIAHRKYKNRWSEIAHLLHKTSRNLIKNRFYTLFRKIRNRVKNRDIYINSPLDLLEIYYVLNLVEQYFDAPADKVVEEKNYAHKLVQRMDRKKVNDYHSKVTELYRCRGTIEDLFKECGRLHGETGDTSTKGEAMECNQIDINEGEEEAKSKITLPCPHDFGRGISMSSEEKDEFWRCAFLDKEAKSAQVGFSVGSSVGSSLFSQVQSAGNMAMREDEGFGFSQFIDPYEGEEKKHANQFLVSSASSPNTQLSYMSSPFQASSFQSALRVKKPVDVMGESAFQSVHSPSAFMSLIRAQDSLFAQRPVDFFPKAPELKSQWK